MGSSFIEIDMKGFWVNDSITELSLFLLKKHLDNSDLLQSYPRFHEILVNNYNTYCSGCKDLFLDEFIQNDDFRQKLVLAIKETLTILVEKETLTQSELDEIKVSMESGRGWKGPLNLKKVIRFLEYLKDLVENRKGWEAAEKVDYWD